MEKLHPIQYLEKMNLLLTIKKNLEELLKIEDNFVSAISEFKNYQQWSIKNSEYHKQLHIIETEITNTGKILEDIQNNPMEY